jgi:uncharacterized protein (TIGR02147 family)
MPKKLNYPNIFGYNDFRLFLSDYQKQRHKLNKEFNKSEFSRMLGLPNTRSYFNDVISGKKVTPEFVERFINIIGFNNAENNYFRVLVKHNQAEKADERMLYFEQLIGLNQTPKRILDKKYFEYYKFWYNSTIRAILHFYDFIDDYSSLAKKVYPSITEKQARESIDLLIHLGLIEQNKKGFYKPVEKSITAPDFIKDELIFQYQLQCLELAKNVIFNKDKTLKLFATNTFSISKSSTPMLEKLISKFRSEVRALANKDTEPAEQVYHLDVLLYPNSR